MDCEKIKIEAQQTFDDAGKGIMDNPYSEEDPRYEIWMEEYINCLEKFIFQN